MRDDSVQDSDTRDFLSGDLRYRPDSSKFDLLSCKLGTEDFKYCKGNM